jgi:Lysozyme like domain
MSNRTKKSSSAPWVLAAGAGLVFAASNGGVPDSGMAAAAESKPSTPGAIVAQAAHDAGFTGNDLVIAIAVAKAESGWRPSVVSPRNPDGTKDCGLWQINSIHKDLLRKNSCFDPKANARMARVVWRNANGSWSSWATYQHSKHLQFISEARTLAAGVQ